MSLLRWLPLLAWCAWLLAGAAHAQPADPTASALAVAAAEGGPAAGLRARLERLSPLQQEAVLWLARCVYSETDRAHEQRLVAWVVRNRVETGFRGNTYREVVLEPRQFSAFNAPTARRAHILRLDERSTSAAWLQALDVALEVYLAPAWSRPFKVTTRHFYSPVSMRGGRKPPWAEHARPLSAAFLGVEAHRFQFFDRLVERRDLSLAPPARPLGKTRVVTVGTAARRRR